MDPGETVQAPWMGCARLRDELDRLRVDLRPVGDRHHDGGVDAGLVHAADAELGVELPSERRKIVDVHVRVDDHPSAQPGCSIVICANALSTSSMRAADGRRDLLENDSPSSACSSRPGHPKRRAEALDTWSPHSSRSRQSDRHRRPFEGQEGAASRRRVELDELGANSHDGRRLTDVRMETSLETQVCLHLLSRERIPVGHRPGVNVLLGSWGEALRQPRLIAG